MGFESVVRPEISSHRRILLTSFFSKFCFILMTLLKGARFSYASTLSLFRPVDRDVFVRGLNRQLGTPSPRCLWIPAKKRTKRRPSGRVHSDAQVSQQETPKLCTSVSEHRVWHSEGDKKKCVYVCVFSLRQRSFPSPLYVTSSTSKQRELVNLPKVRTNLVSNILRAI